MKRKHSKTLLDVGCGNGKDTLYFFRKGIDVTAIDFSESGIRALQSKHTGIHCMRKDLRTMRFKRNSFDAIYAHLSLHYFNDATTTAIFNTLYTILKKGGLLFVKCKSTDDALFGKGKKVGENMYTKGHMRHFFSKEYMKKKCARFTILNIRKTVSVYHQYKSSFIEAIATK